MSTVPRLSIYLSSAIEGAPLDWEKIYLDLAPRLYNYFRFQLGQERDAEDLTARTFEKAWAARKKYRRDLAGYSTWLFTIAQNVVIDYLRSQRIHLPIDHADEVIFEDTTAFHPERHSDLSRLAFLTKELKPREKELIALKYGAELTNRDIARLTGLSESNVGSSLHRIVKSLQKQW